MTGRMVGGTWLGDDIEWGRLLWNLINKINVWRYVYYFYVMYRRCVFDSQK